MSLDKFNNPATPTRILRSPGEVVSLFNRQSGGIWKWRKCTSQNN